MWKLIAAAGRAGSVSLAHQPQGQVRRPEDDSRPWEKLIWTRHECGWQQAAEVSRVIVLQMFLKRSESLQPASDGGRGGQTVHAQRTALHFQRALPVLRRWESRSFVPESALMSPWNFSASSVLISHTHTHRKCSHSYGPGWLAPQPSTCWLASEKDAPVGRLLMKVSFWWVM